MTKAFFLICLASVTLSAQHKFGVKNASKHYDLRVAVENCDERRCSGQLKVELFKKSAPASFQTINLNETAFQRAVAEYAQIRQAG